MRLIGGCEIARFGPVVKQSSMLFAENTGCCTARAGRNRREQRAALDGRCKPGGSCYLTSATASQRCARGRNLSPLLHLLLPINMLAATAAWVGC